MKVKIVMLTIVTMYLILTVSAECASPNLWTELFPNENRARSFETPNDLRTHLDSLSNYYAVVGRPRLVHTYSGPYSERLIPTL